MNVIYNEIILNYFNIPKLDTPTEFENTLEKTRQIFASVIETHNSDYTPYNKTGFTTFTSTQTFNSHHHRTETRKTSNFRRTDTRKTVHFDRTDVPAPAVFPVVQEKPVMTQPTVIRNSSNICPIPGIPNIGNSCYINASLQALFSSPDFLGLIDPSSEDQICQNLISLLHSLKDTSSMKLRAVAKLRFSVYISQRNEDLSSGILGQKDAMQLMRVLLESVGYSKISLVEKKWSHAARFDEATDENKYSAADSQFDLQMPIPPLGGALQDIVTSYFSIQHVNDNFRGHSSYSSQLSINGSPGNPLILSLKRFDNSLNKIHSNITLPSDGILSIDSHTYRIAGCIQHIGDTLVSGHYIAYRQHDGKWYECDDETVKEVDYQSILFNPRGESYAFVLEKVTVPNDENDDMVLVEDDVVSLEDGDNL